MLNKKRIKYNKTIRDEKMLEVLALLSDFVPYVFQKSVFSTFHLKPNDVYGKKKEQV